MKNGKYVPAAMQKINWILRDWRKDETTRWIRPDRSGLGDAQRARLARADQHHLAATARTTPTRCCATPSADRPARAEHILGKAIDVHFPDVP